MSPRPGEAAKSGQELVWKGEELEAPGLFSARQPLMKALPAPLIGCLLSSASGLTAAGVQQLAARTPPDHLSLAPAEPGGS